MGLPKGESGLKLSRMGIPEQEPALAAVPDDPGGTAFTRDPHRFLPTSKVLVAHSLNLLGYKAPYDLMEKE